VPPSPDKSDCECDDYDVDGNNNNNSHTSNFISNINALSNSPSSSQFEDNFHNNQSDLYQSNNTPTTSNNYNSPNPNETYYTRNRSTTRSWPVIYRNNSLTNQQNNNSNYYLEPNCTKTEQLQSRSEQQKRKSTHQYDFDQIFGLNNANYQQYLASHRKSSNFNFDPGYDKSPSIYDMQQNQDSPEQTQTGGFCSAPPTIIFLLLTLIMTTSATSMLCAAFLTGKRQANKFIEHFRLLFRYKLFFISFITPRSCTRATHTNTLFMALLCCFQFHLCCEFLFFLLPPHIYRSLGKSLLGSRSINEYCQSEQLVVEKYQQTRVSIGWKSCQTSFEKR
jgi:hypothetical protein